MTLLWSLKHVRSKGALLPKPDRSWINEDRKSLALKLLEFLPNHRRLRGVLVVAGACPRLSDICGDVVVAVDVALLVGAVVDKVTSDEQGTGTGPVGYARSWGTLFGTTEPVLLITTDDDDNNNERRDLRCSSGVCWLGILPPVQPSCSSCCVLRLPQGVLAEALVVPDAQQPLLL